MNNVSIQAPQPAVQPASLQSLAGQNGTGADGGDLSFVRLLMSVLGAGAEASLAAQLKKNAETLGLQMNAELLALNPLLAMALSGQNSPDAQPQTDMLSLMGQPLPDALSQNAALAPELLAQLQEPADAAPVPEAAAENPQNFAAALEVMAGDGDAQIITAAAVRADTFSAGALALQGASQFERAVSQAHRLIKEAGGGKADSAELDLEALQKKVDSGAFLPHLAGAIKADTLPAVAEIDNAPDAREIFSQIKASVTRHVEDGATDFTIKLRPEGLGEITVKLLETGGKVTLSLAASDAHVQRLLGSELNQLRDIMRPYNVEVSQVVGSDRPPGMNMNPQQQFSQQFSQHGHAQQQAAAFAYDPGYGDSAPPDAPAQQAALPDAMLDAYI